MAVVHNGTKRALADVFGTKSDTEAIIPILLSINNKKTIKKILKNTGVVFAINFNNKKIYFHKDDTRPLVIKKGENLFCSEPIKDGKWAPIKNCDEWINDLSQLRKYSGKYEKAKFCSWCNRYHLGDGCKWANYLGTYYRSSRRFY